MVRWATWTQFNKANPDLAGRGARLLGVGVAYIATVSRDGSPRVHPFTPLIEGGRLLALVAKHTVKYGNLLRDPCCSIHAVLGDSDEEFMIIGRGVRSDDPATRMQAAIAARRLNMTSQNDEAFEFFVERAHWAIWEGLGTPDIHRVAQGWSATVA
jgi:hypothetical protein